MNPARTKYTWLIIALPLVLSLILVISPAGKKWLSRLRRNTTAYVASLDLFAPSPVLPANATVSPADGMLMVYIPAGDFIMGSNDELDPKSTPEHAVYLDAYWMDRTEVTNAMYLKCIHAGQCVAPVAEDTNPYLENPFYGDYPVTYTRWGDAEDYCSWAGRRLPTEAEWEKAGRGTDGRLYPWGNEQPNTGLLNYDDNLGGPLPVARYPSGASPYGVLNMAGNVREWVNDWYRSNYYENAPSNNPAGPLDGFAKVLRGGSFLDTDRQIRIFNRFGHYPDSPGSDRGFRCAMNAK